jgi:Tfp pilus assembly protein PilF
MNLALTLEHAGQFDEAEEAYKAALEVAPGHIPTMQALTRLQLRRGRSTDQSRDFLKEIALRGETAEWRQWARFERARSEP